MPFGYVSYISAKHNMTERDQRKVINATIQRRGGINIHEVVEKFADSMVGFNEAVRIAHKHGAALIFYQPYSDLYQVSSQSSRKAMEQINVVTCQLGHTW